MPSASLARAWVIVALALPLTALTAGAQSPQIRMADITVPEGNVGSADAVLTVTLSAAATDEVTVSYATENVTATGSAACGGDTDYVTENGTVLFSPGQTSQPLGVAVCGDTAVEDNERFRVRLSNASGATIQDQAARVTITNDDAEAIPLPSVSIDDVSFAEGNAGIIVKNVTLRLSAPTSQTVTVAIATLPGGTATSGTCFAGGDFQFAPRTVTILAGQDDFSVGFTICGELVDEPDETFQVGLSNPVNATLGDAVGLGTITDDDATPPPVLVIDAFRLQGGASSVRVNTPVTLDATIRGGTPQEFKAASCGTDFTAAAYQPWPLTPPPVLPGFISAGTRIVCFHVRTRTLSSAVARDTIQVFSALVGQPGAPTQGFQSIPPTISSFQIKGGLPFATRQGPKPLNVTAFGGATEFRSSFATSPACEAALQSQAFQPFSASNPPNVFLGNDPGRRHVCIQLRRGTETSLVAKDDIEIVPSESASIAMGRNLQRVAGVDEQRTLQCDLGELAVGINVRSADLVDAIGLRCADLGDNGEHGSVSSTAMIGGNGGTLRGLDCASGQVLYGLQGRSGEVIDQVGLRCIGWRSDIGSNGTHILRASAGGNTGDVFGPVVCPGPLAVRTLTSRKHLGLLGGLRFGCSAPAGM